MRLGIASFVFGACSLLIALVVSAPARAATSDDPAIESAKDILGQGRFVARHPWYDPETDAERPIRVRPQPAPRQSNFNFDFSLFQLFKYLGWTLLAAALATMLYFIIRAWVMRDKGVVVQAGPSSDGAEIDQADKVEALPFRLNRQTKDLLAEARRCYEAGDYGEAVIYLYSHQLVELDKRQLIHLTRGKTNRQYLRELRQRLSLQGILERTMVAFEDVFFGDHPLDRERFESCWTQLDRFHALALQGATV